MTVGEKYQNMRLIKIAIFGLLVSFVLSSVSASLADKFLSSQSDHSNFYADIFSLTGLWVGLIITAVYGALSSTIPFVAKAGVDAEGHVIDQVDTVNPKDAGGSFPGINRGHLTVSKVASSSVDFYGYKIKPFRDLPVGIAVGVLAQLYLTPLFTWPLSFFVHNLTKKISEPANSLVHNLSHPEIIILGFFVCVMSPLVEELFFRGLLQRGCFEAFANFAGQARAVVSVILTAGIFALAHFELLQLLPLFAFGIVLGTLAWSAKRLGPGVVAHMSFNTVAYVIVARGHF